MPSFAFSLTNEKKEYYATPNKKKHLFWDDVAEKINKLESVNCFTDDDCHKKIFVSHKSF